MAASRKSSHKMKSSITDSRKKSLLRVHRRSLDQREMRQEEVNKRRQLDDMSPVIESQEASKNPSTAGTPVIQKATQSRLDMLKKWKEERELKRKLEAMEKARSKPGFKVTHVAHKDSQLYQKMKGSKTASVNEVAKPAAAKPVPPAASKVPKSASTITRVVKTKTAPPPTKTAAATTTKRTAAPAQPVKKPAPPTTRATRNRGATATTKAVSPVPQKKAKQSPPKRAARSNFMAPTAASRTRAVAATRKDPVPAAAAEKKTRAGQPRVATVKYSDKMSTRRGQTQSPEKPSFAPRDFVFEAPSSMPSFVFKPLSPASAAGFLFPQANANNTTMSAFEERVGRTSTPKCEAPPTSSSKEGKSAEAKNPVSDSAIEMSAGIDYSNSRIPVENSSADTAAHAMESKTFTSDQSFSPIKNLKGKKNRKSTPKKMDADITAGEKNQPVEEAEYSSCLQMKKGGKRKSKQVTIQEEPVDLKEEEPAAKQRRKSRRSTIRSESITESVSEIVEEAVTEEAISTQSSLLEKEHGEKEASRRKSRRSRRSLASKSEESLQEDVAPEKERKVQEEETTAVRKSRRSRRSILPSAVSHEESEPMKTESVEIEEVQKNATESGVHSPKRRRSRRSVVKQQKEESTEKDISNEDKPASTTKTVTLADFDTKIEIPGPSTPENQHCLRNRHAKDDMFLPPGPPVSSQKRSTKRRRRTAAMIALSSAKSPEEAIKIIATSPMVEMTRRTPKSKISPELRNQSTALVFGDDDFALEPVQLSYAFDASCTDAITTDAKTTDDDTATDDGATMDDAGAAHDQPAASTSSATQETVGSCSCDSGSEKRDVTPFRQQLSAEIEKLTQLSDHWIGIKEANSDLAEEVEGQIRTTVCQAQLLMDKKGKFHQFAGLVDKCEAGDSSTTCQDLHGFWDMIFLQAEDIYNKFNQLERLQQNNWQPEVSTVGSSSQPAKKVKKPATGGKKKVKPVVNSKFAAFRAEMMRLRKAREGSGGVGNMPVPEEKVFDAGFFKVNSPVRSPQYHCEAGTPSKCKSTNETKTASSTATASETSSSNDPATAVSPKKIENKENMAQVLLRRSVGATSGRRSYIPVVPSPLLQDGAPAAGSPPKSPLKSPSKSPSKPLESTAENSQAGVAVPPSTPVRHRRSLLGRRTRSRRSLSVLERSQEISDDMEQEEVVDLMPYLRPSSSQSDSLHKESVIDDSPFSCEDIFKHSKSDTPVSTAPSVQPLSGHQRKSSLKVLPSRERRQSRRSVSFAASASTSTRSMALPSTPYNRRSLVAQKRVTQHSMSSPSQGDQSALGELQELASTPPLRRSARPSLLYTPPKVDKSKLKTPTKDVPVATLISLSP